MRAALTRRIVRSSLKTALVVGAILNFINQGHLLFDMQSISFLHAALNFVVPFCVASFSAAGQKIERAESPGRQSMASHSAATIGAGTG